MPIRRLYPTDNTIDSGVIVPLPLWDRIVSQLEKDADHYQWSDAAYVLLCDVRQHFDGPDETD